MRYTTRFMQAHAVVLIDIGTDAVTVGTVADPSAELVRLLEAFHCRRVVFRRIDRDELLIRIQQSVADDGVIASDWIDPDASGVSIVATDDGTPAVNLANSLLNDAVRASASDVHIVAQTSCVSMQYRIDGRLQPASPLPQSLVAAVVARLKIMAGLDVAERRRPQDGGFSALVSGDAFDVRLSAVPVIDGESLVMRLFRRRHEALDIEQLGMPPEVLDAVREAIVRPSGMILVSGPTGSGKSTTLHTAITRISGSERKIITIEDPVEYRLAGVVQIQTNPTVGLTFEEILKRILRHDPDVIMVGEIRDPATAALSIRAALTGHLVLSTIHTRSAEDVAARLVDLGVNAALVASVSPIIIAQRLVRTLCAACACEQPITPDEAEWMSADAPTLRRAVGCDRCRGTGYRGRTGLFSLYERDGRTRTLKHDGLAKIRAGITTVEEVAWATSV